MHSKTERVLIVCAEVPQHLNKRYKTPPRVSIIMPVYNAEDTVVRAIESVRAQTVTEFELLIIDDQSTDKSRESIVEYLQNVSDGRIRFLENMTNKGVSSTRNRGIAESKGEWLAFIDSDDTYKRNFLETMLNNARNVDVVSSGHELAYQNGIRRYRASGAPGTYSKERAQMMALEYKLSPFVWDKIFRKSAVGDLKFPEISRFEDSGFCVAILGQVKAICVISDSLYDYSVNQGSITWGSTPPSSTERRRYDSFINEYVKFSEGSRRQQNALAVNRVFNCIISAHATLYRRPENYRDSMKQIRSELNLPLLFRCLQGRPVVGVSGLLLNSLPSVYAGLYRTYVRFAYRL